MLDPKGVHLFGDWYFVCSLLQQDLQVTNYISVCISMYALSLVWYGIMVDVLSLGD